MTSTLLRAFLKLVKYLISLTEIYNIKFQGMLSNEQKINTSTYQVV